MPRTTALTILSLLSICAAVPAAGAETANGPSCEGELPFVLNAAVAPTGRFQLHEVEDLAQDLFQALYRQRSPCQGSRSLQVNLAVASEYHVLQWLEEGSVDLAVVPELSLHLLKRGEVELLEIDLAGLDFSEEGLRRHLAEVILPQWRPTLVARAIRGEAATGPAREPGPPAAELEALRRWLWSGLDEAPGALVAVHHWGEDRCPGPDEDADPGVRLTLPSHLSTAGFVYPVAQTRRWLAGRTAGIGRRAGLDAENLQAAAEACFWRRFFDHTCFRLEEYRIESSATPGGAAEPAADSCALRWRAKAGAGSLVELRAGREEAGEPGQGAAPEQALDGGDLGPPFRDHLVVRRKQAEAIFDLKRFPRAASDLPAELEALLEAAASLRGPGDPVRPSVFRSLALPEPHLGARTFAFTPRESIDLLGIHQRFSDRPRLAVVLPGGGVKAAFQSRLLERLYGDGLLRNARADAPARGGTGAVRVDSVVGTSGGALLGFFVARLGSSGPWGLSEILWKRPSLRDPDREVYLNAFDIFGGTDLPRYLSLLVIYGLFTLFLAFFSLRYKGWLAPERNGAAGGERAPSIRPPLFWLLVGVLGLTPLFVKIANGSTSDEHVPEFEGLLYAVLVVVAIFADQTLIRTERVEETADEARSRVGGPVWSPPGVLLGVGAALVAIPLLVKALAWLTAAEAGGLLARRVAYLEREVLAGEAYLFLGAVVAGLMLAAMQRARGLPGALAEAGLFVGVFAVGTAVAIPALRALPESWLTLLDRTPLLFLALGMILVTLGLVRLSGAAPRPKRFGIERGFAWLEERAARIRASRLVRRAATALAPLVGCFVILDLTRPEAETFLADGWFGALTEVSKLEAPRGGLAVCLGAVLVAMGGVLGLHRRRNHYRLDRPQEFVDGVMFVILGLALAVYSALGLGVFGLTLLEESDRFDDSPLFQRLSELSLFELTPAFWVGVAALTVVGSLAILLTARWGGKRGWKVAGWLHQRLVWLCSRHPNGHLVSRRFVRLGLYGVGGLLWWNFVLAPALYGNRVAYEYLERANARFERAYPAAEDGDGEAATPSYRLTAQFLAPANALKQDGTRFVLAVPEEEDCPQVRTSTGVTWVRFRAIHGAEAEPKQDACENLVLAEDEQRKELMNYVFASGSPFPAFPPRRVPGPNGDLEPLVDGGYSNLVPIEAAANLDAVQALVVHSSNPLPPPAEPGVLANLAGPLVHNVPRLFGFLYQRSQQLDRRSRSLLFVVSLAPPYRADWPLLTDFRRATVERMVGAADEAFEERIGLVESWGPPLFQFHVTVPSRAEPEG